MGYYSSVDFEVSIPKDKIKEFNEKAEDLEKKEGWFSYYEGLRANEDGNLEYADGEYYRKHYESEKLAYLIQEHGGRGRILFNGEDRENWGFSLKDNGVFEIECGWIETNKKAEVN